MKPLAWDLPVPGGEPYTVTAKLVGLAEEVARRVEALDLLVAQARVGLANAVLVHQLERLKSRLAEIAVPATLAGR